ncbi:MAG: PepSY-associated TM helix domain-containing protein [Hyphomonadaceae bacterium]
MKASTVRAWKAVHTWSSVICTAFLLMLCVTGAVMIWIHEIDAHFAGHPPIPEAPVGTGPANLDEVFDDAQNRVPDERITYVDWAFDGVLLGVNMSPPDNPRQRRQLVYDARTGEFLEDTRTDNPNHPVRVFLRIANRLHIQMFAGLAGEFFLAGMTVLFVVATVSGLVLYAPFMRKLEFGEIRNRSSRVRWLDLHNLLGVATAGWVLVVAITGIMNAFTVPLYAAWRQSAVPELVAPYTDQPLADVRVGPQAATDAAHESNPGSRMIRIVEPGFRDGSPRHYVVWTQGFTPVTKKLFRPVLVEAETGEVVVADPPPWYLAALQLSRPLHFGDYAGWPLKLLWTILDLIAIAILWSGLQLFVKRRLGRAT